MIISGGLNIHPKELESVLTGVDVGGKVIEFIEKNARPGRTKTSARG